MPVLLDINRNYKYALETLMHPHGDASDFNRESVTLTLSSTKPQHSKPNNPQSAIMHKIAKIDKFGRISIPVKMRKNLGLKESTAAYIDRDDELITRPIHTKTPDAVKKISEMELPVEDWETMEQKIESGAVNE